MNFFKNNFLAFSILIAGVLVSWSVFYSNGSSKVGTAQIGMAGEGDIKVDVSEDDDPILGNKNAEVTVIEFSDYQCPFCRSFWKDTLPLLKSEYIDTGKIKLVFRDYPLAFHAMAKSAATAANCAGKQGKYWEMHDKIFTEQEKLGQGTIQFDSDDLKKWATDLNLKKNQFDQCFDGDEFNEEIAADTADGNKAGVSGTPSFFINGKKIVGAQPFSVFKATIDEELGMK